MNKIFMKIINQALLKQGLSARRASILATGTPELIRNMRRGRVPSIERFHALCKVLNLEFYVGPVRPDNTNPTRAYKKRETLHSMLEEIMLRLPPRDAYTGMAEPATSPYTDLKPDDTRYIPLYEMSTIAGKTKKDEITYALSHIALQNSWFDKHKLDPKHCVILKVSDESMEPTIPNRSVVLIDRSQRERRTGCIYAIRINDRLEVKRLHKNKDGWQLLGDHPQWKITPLLASTEIIGEVKWIAKTLT